MADTYTTASKARLIQDATRSGTWGPVINSDSLELIDDGAIGFQDINIGAATTYAMAAIGNGSDSETRAAYWKFTGTPASAVTVTVPASLVGKKKRVDNQTGQNLTVKYAASTGITLLTGTATYIWCDGAEVYDDLTITPHTVKGSTSADYILVDGSAANTKRWRIRANGSGQLQYGVTSDDLATANNYMLVDRTTTTPTKVAFPLTTANSFFIGATGTVVNGLMAQFNGATGVFPFGSFSTDSAIEAAYLWNKATSGNNAFVSFQTEGTPNTRGSITYNRGGGLVAYNTTSDARLKTNIADAISASSIIDSLRVRSFDWKDGGAHVDHWFVAQELYEVAPIAVTRGDDGDAVENQWSIDPGKLVPLLVKEIQELRARVAALESA